MDEKIDVQEVRSRAARGNRQLLTRQAVIQFLNFFGGVIIARVLSPEEVGLFVIVSFIIGIFGFLGDLGLGASLIQRKNELTDRDLQIAFSLQTGLLFVLVTALIFLTPFLVWFYPNVKADFSRPVEVMAVSLFMISWRSISVIQMERRLIFNKIALIEIIESLLYQGTAVVFAVSGYGIWSLVLAFLLRSIAGAVLAYFFAPWPVRLRFNLPESRKLLRFGIPFQYQFFVNQLTSAVTPALVGAVAGPLAVGYLSWALSLAAKPLMIVDNISRVGFPLFSRLQNDRAAFFDALTRYLVWVSLVNVLWAVLICCAGRELVEIIYTAKWLGAVPALIIFSAATPFHGFIWLVAVSLNAGARLGIVNWFVSLRAVGYWVLSIPFLFFFGPNGVAVANLVVNAGLLLLLLFFAGKDYVKLIAANRWVFAAGFIACISVLVLKKLTAGIFNWGPVLTAGFTLFATLSIYLATAYYLAPGWALREVENMALAKKLKYWRKNVLE